VHTKPDEAAPILTYFNAGTTVVAAADAVSTTPAGWLATELPGPFEGYVQGKDLTKSLDVKPGALIYQEPKITSGVVAVAEKGDKATLTGVLRGKWTQLRLEKKLTGYIRVSGVSTYVAPGAAAPAPFAPAPVTPSAYGLAAPGQAAASLNLGDSGASSLPRQFAGKFVSTRRPFAPRRPFDWALNDDAGVRYAYLDVTKLLLTDQLEKYIDHAVVVFGAAKATPDGKDIVIQIETLQLK